MSVLVFDQVLYIVIDIEDTTKESGIEVSYSVIDIVPYTLWSYSTPYIY